MALKLRLPKFIIEILMGSFLIWNMQAVAKPAEPVPFAEQNLPPQLTQKIDRIIADARRTQNLPSVALGVWIPGKGNYLTAQGEANLLTHLSRSPRDPFRIASITKTIIALGILLQIDQGVLHWNDPLAKWFPDFPNADQITLADLLKMRSGIVDGFGNEVLHQWYDDPTAAMTGADLIERTAKRSAEFSAPSQTSSYNNLNYIFLEQILRRVVQRNQQQSLPDYLSQAIFKPLGMNSTVYPGAAQFDLPGPVKGYSWNADAKKFEDKTRINPAFPGGAGAVISTLEDLHRLVRALYKGDLLKLETHRIQLLSYPINGSTLKYGAGIVESGHFYGHNGTIVGFSSEMWYLPEQDAVIIINVNRLDRDDRSQSAALFGQVAQILFDRSVFEQRP